MEPILLLRDIIYITMKTLIFSDIHLTNKFDSQKFSYLKELIQQYDKVIINGDFWDSWFTTFDEFINSSWSSLFPLLLEKECIYIYGNHDPKEKCDSRVAQFSIIAINSYDLKIEKEIYHLEHGHFILEGKKSRFLENYHSFVYGAGKTKFGWIIYNLLHLGEILGYKILGTRYMTNAKVGKENNKILKQNSPKDCFLVCSDTHCAELDTGRKFANTGCIQYGKASYIAIEDGKLGLHNEKY